MRRLTFVLVLACSSCAPLQPPSADAPRGEAAYPFVITEDPERREVALAAASQLFQPATSEPPTLQPVTATIRSLPAGFNLYLPKLGTAPVMTEEETRESLRRFLRDWSGLIGADSTRLSLVERLDAGDSKIANYEHRPFRYPIRGPYGKVQIRFAADRRVLSLSSTSIPNAERLQPAIASMVPKLTAEDATARIRKGVSYESEPGKQSSLPVTAATELVARDLVLYVSPSPTSANALEFHLAWEVEVGGGASRKVYVDAITGDVVAVE
ncbi:MAG TPA: PepSY domain-containing protein [Pyrinomonadaceae bacterium]|nr:PepSY domain-containing protein [Pyrinomonadaceae bacterium]